MSMRDMSYIVEAESEASTNKEDFMVSGRAGSEVAPEVFGVLVPEDE